MEMMADVDFYLKIILLNVHVEQRHYIPIFLFIYKFFFLNNQTWAGISKESKPTNFFLILTPITGKKISGKSLLKLVKIFLVSHFLKLFFSGF